MKRTVISSLHNPQIKKLIQLTKRNVRNETGLTVVEGWREVQAAYKSGVVFESLYVGDSFLKSEIAKKKFVGDLEIKNVPIFELTQEVLGKVVFGDRQEGILAICKPSPWTLNDLSIKKDAFIVVVEQVEKPGNLGAILRTCDGAKVDGVIVCDGTDIYNPNVIRSSLGAVFTLKVVQSSSEETFSFLKKQGINICATSPDAKLLYVQNDFKKPTAIVLGSEDKGLSDFWLKHTDKSIRIPLYGQVNSLNVSASAAIVIYEALRQRSKE